MQIKVTEVIPIVSERYPYSHRVEVSGDSVNVSTWLDENHIPYVTTDWGVYYLRSDHVNWLLLKWS